MKKCFFVLILSGFTALCADAQVYMGGSLGIDFNAGNTAAGSNITRNPSYFSFHLSPLIGFSLSENFSLGARASIGFDRSNNRMDTPTLGDTISWGLMPFMRNVLIKGEKLSLLLESGIGFRGSSSSSTTGSTTTNGKTTFGFAISAMPVLSYSLSDKLSIELHSGLLSLGFLSESVKMSPERDAPKQTDNYFGLGVNSGSRHMKKINSGKAGETKRFHQIFELGVIYKF